MTRRQAVAFFLGDAAFLADTKFRALSRRLPDPDDFNSAVGAWFIALAAARRNGRPEIDVAAESASRFVGDLVAAGLLSETGFHAQPFVEWSPKSPTQAAAGRVRAATAVRGPGGTFLPASSSIVQHDQRAGVLVPLDQPSPPLPSGSSQENDVLGEDRGVQGGDDPVATYWTLTTRMPRGKGLQWCKDLGEDHGFGPASAAMAAAWSESDDLKTFLSRTKDRLVAAERAAELREKADELKRLREKRATSKVVAVPEPERVGELMGDIRKAMGR
jgi:hypothetical protein